MPVHSNTLKIDLTSGACDKNRLKLAKSSPKNDKTELFIFSIQLVATKDRIERTFWWLEMLREPVAAFVINTPRSVVVEFERSITVILGCFNSLRN